MHTTDNMHSTDDVRRLDIGEVQQSEPMMPRSLTRDGVSERRDFFTGLSNAVRDNPLPATLIGMGFLWMLMGGRKTTLGDALSPEAARSVLGSVSDTAGSAGRSVKHAAESAVSTISSTVGNAAESLAETASSIGHSIMPAHSSRPEIGREIDRYSSRPRQSYWRNSAVQQSLMQMFEERPILLGAAGMAIGAGIAASLPTSSTERQVMGKASSYVRDKASEVSQQVKEMASAAAEEAQIRGTGRSPRGETTTN